MNVTGYLALYTTLLGWQQYQNLWGLITGTGLVYLPFLAIILRSTLGPYTSMGAKDAAQIAVRRLVINVLTALLIIMICAVPCMTLSPKVLHFEPACQQTAGPATPGHTGTTYDSAFPIPTAAKIPIMWYLVMSVANGFTHAAITGLSCAPIQYRELKADLEVATIKSAALKEETKQFYNDCYVPAYDTFLNGNLSQSQQQQIQTLEQQYGLKDVSWLGSQIFLTVPGFYNTLRASRPISGFPFDPNRDQIEGQVSNHSKWGEPYCTNWWSAPSVGLHDQLLQQFPPSFTQQLLHIGSNTTQLENAAIKQLIFNNMPDMSTIQDYQRGYESLSDSENGASASIYNTLLGTIGVGVAAPAGFTVIHLIVNALPIIQAAILFCLYAFLAIAIPFSGYRPGFIVTASIVMFSVIFCSYIWHLVMWFDSHLIAAMFPGASYTSIMPGFFGQAAHSSSEIFVNLIIGTMYISCPVFFMVVMSWAGLQAGAVFGAILGPMSTPAQQAGSKAIGTVVTAAKGAIPK